MRWPADGDAFKVADISDRQPALAGVCYGLIWAQLMLGQHRPLLAMAGFGILGNGTSSNKDQQCFCGHMCGCVAFK